MENIYRVDRMKIFISSSYVPPEKGAAVTRIQSFKKTWEMEGNEIFYISPKHKLLHNGSVEKNTIFYKNWVDYMKICRMYKPDIIVTTVPPAKIGIINIIIKKIMKIDYIIDFRDPSFIRSRSKSLKEKIQLYYNYFLEILVIKNSKFIFSVSVALKNYLTQIENNKKIFLIPNGVPSIFFKSFGHQAKEKTIIKFVYHGIIGGRRIDEFVFKISEYEHLLENCLFELILIKDRYSIKYIEKIKKFIYSNKIQSKIQMNYNLSLKNLSKILLTQDVGIIMLPDNEDEQYCEPVKFFEYIASGLTVVSLCSEKSSLAKLTLKFDAGYYCTNWHDFFIILNKISTNKLSLKKINIRKIQKEIDRNIISKEAITIIEQELIKKK